MPNFSNLALESLKLGHFCVVKEENGKALLALWYSKKNLAALLEKTTTHLNFPQLIKFNPRNSRSARPAAQEPDRGHGGQVGDAGKVRRLHLLPARHRVRKNAIIL